MNSHVCPYAQAIYAQQAAHRLQKQFYNFYPNSFYNTFNGLNPKTYTRVAPQSYDYQKSHNYQQNQAMPVKKLSKTDSKNKDDKSKKTSKTESKKSKEKKTKETTATLANNNRKIKKIPIKEEKKVIKAKTVKENKPSKQEKNTKVIVEKIHDKNMVTVRSSGDSENSIKKKIVYLGVVTTDPAEYIEKYGEKHDKKEDHKVLKSQKTGKAISFSSNFSPTVSTISRIGVNLSLSDEEILSLTTKKSTPFMVRSATPHISHSLKSNKKPAITASINESALDAQVMKIAKKKRKTDRLETFELDKEVQKINLHSPNGMSEGSKKSETTPGIQQILDQLNLHLRQQKRK